MLRLAYVGRAAVVAGMAIITASCADEKKEAEKRDRDVEACSAEAGNEFDRGRKPFRELTMSECMEKKGWRPISTDAGTMYEPLDSKR